MRARLGLAVGLVVGLIAAPAGPVSAQTLDKIAATKTVVIGYRETSYPLSYAANDGRPIGYHIDVCARIVDRIKAKLGLGQISTTYQLVTSDTRMTQLIDGKIDLECGSTTNTAARQKAASFSPTTFLARTRVAVRKDDGIKELAQLNGRAVVTTHGSNSVDMLRAKYPNLRIRAVFGEDHAQSFAILGSGAASAFAMDDNLLAGLIASSPDPGKFLLLGEALDYQPIAIMFRKDDPAFKAVVDETVAGMMKSGEMEKLYDQWFTKPIPPAGIVLNFPLTPMLKQMFLYPGADTPESFRPPE